jgi:hypothetical protein
MGLDEALNRKIKSIPIYLRTPHPILRITLSLKGRGEDRANKLKLI